MTLSDKRNKAIQTLGRIGYKPIAIIMFINEIKKQDKEFIRLLEKKPTKEQVIEFNNIHRKSSFESIGEWERYFYIWRMKKLAGDELI